MRLANLTEKLGFMLADVYFCHGLEETVHNARQTSLQCQANKPGATPVVRYVVSSPSFVPDNKTRVPMPAFMIQHYDSSADPSCCRMYYNVRSLAVLAEDCSGVVYYGHVSFGVPSGFIHGNHPCFAMTG